MPTTQPWRVLITRGGTGAYNMALDEALLERAADQPTLRFYDWSPPCVSIGLAQRLERDVDLRACADRGIDVVRRATGGRAILHDREVTYALVAPLDDPLIGSPNVAESYRVISRALCVGLERLGIHTELAPRPDRRAAQSAACFDLAGDYEITVGGRKLVGSAQRRQHGSLLQHGSILLHADADQLASVLRLPDQMNGAILDQRLVALDQIVDSLPSFDQVVAALISGFEHAWSIKLVPDQVTHAEHARALELVDQKYGNWAWTGRR